MFAIIYLGDIMRIILHVDVNNAFLSWTAVEMLKNGGKVDIESYKTKEGTSSSCIIDLE